MTPPKKAVPRKATPEKPKPVPRRRRMTPEKATPAKKTPPPKPPATPITEVEDPGARVFELRPGQTRGRRRSNGSKTSQKAVRVADRRALALALKRQGANFVQIAETVRDKFDLDDGYDNRAAWEDVRTAIEKVKIENVHEYVDEQNARLDAWLLRVSEQIAKGDLDAINIALKIEKRRADLLGLDAARRVQVTGANGEPIQFQAVPIGADDDAYESALAAVNAVLGPPKELEA